MCSYKIAANTKKGSKELTLTKSTIEKLPSYVICYISRKPYCREMNE